MTIETKTTKQTTTFNASDLAKLLSIQPKAARQALRQLAKTDESPLLRVREGGSYEWTKRELDAVAKKLTKAQTTKPDTTEKTEAAA